MKRTGKLFLASIFGLGLVWTCPFDSSLREYLSAYFWMPFPHRIGSDAARNPRGQRLPFAGLLQQAEDSALNQLRRLYRRWEEASAAEFTQALAAARAMRGLSPQELDEIDLLDAKADLRMEQYESAKAKLTAFLRSARTNVFASEARGWLARSHYRLGEQSAAGKIYLDELERSDSNLSQEVLISSLRIVYGHDGGQLLRRQIADYFDSAAHAAFALRLLTNPQRETALYEDHDGLPKEAEPLPYARLVSLLETHKDLMRTESGAASLALLSMRVALRAGDPRAALRLAANVPAKSVVRQEPEFLWMLGSSRFLTKDFGGAAQPLLTLFGSRRASLEERATAAAGLVGVYQRLGNPIEQLRFALWLRANGSSVQEAGPSEWSIHWMASGFDLGLLLDGEASIETLEAFVAKYPRASETRLVIYSLGVRLAREKRYQEAAERFDSIQAKLRSRRMRELSALWGETEKLVTSPVERLEAKLRFAEYLDHNRDRLFFNDRLWQGYQTYAFTAENDSRLNRVQRVRQIGLERKLRDEQEELWLAQRIAREIVAEEGPLETRRKAAELAMRSLRRLGPRFGRFSEVKAADIEMYRWLNAHR